VGALVAGIAFLAVLLNGKLTLLRPDLLSNFYDLQAHRFLSLRWDVPVHTLGLEGFHIDGKNYMYFGPWPAFLRLPFVALTDELDGRLSQLSMLLAFVVAMGFVVRLVGRIRVMVRGDDPVTTLERWAVAIFVLAVGVTVPLFLATQLSVFNEAEIWGMALALGAFDVLLAFLARPRPATLALASALATAAILSRPPVGAGAVIALGLLAAASLSARSRRFVALPDDGHRWFGWLVLACAVPVGAYVYVNMAKFGSPFGLPFDRQFVALASPEQRATLRANGGSLFGLQFVPTNLLIYLRPDGFDLTRLWPWVRFPGPPPIIGDVRFQRITPTTSIVGAMPLQTALAAVGLVAVLVPRRACASAIAALRVPLLGAALGVVPVLAFGFVAQRYLGDFVPLMVLLGALGLHVLLAWAARADRRRRMGALIAVAVTAVVTIWFGAGLAVLFQRVIASEPDDLRAFVRSQFAVQRRVPGGSPETTRVRKLPPRAALGTVAVLGDCRGVFVSTGTAWRALELTPATGRYRLRVSLPPTSSGRGFAPLLRAGRANGPMMFFVDSRPGNRFVFWYSRPNGVTNRSPAVRLDPGPHLVDLVLDRRTQEISASVDGEMVMRVRTIPSVSTIVGPLGRVVIGDGGGREPAPGRFPGSIEPVVVRPSLCREITGRA
jgi:hypothetical protein